MALRLDNSIVRGEIDNRKRDIVVGRIWLYGRSEPIKLVLQGNPHRDIAGCRVKFSNGSPDEGDQVDLAPIQHGKVGDITASRKVLVTEDDQFTESGNEPGTLAQPPSTCNCLYLEWFSEENGRVVIESINFSIIVSPPQWIMSKEEELLQIEQNVNNMRRWLRHLELTSWDNTPTKEREPFEPDWEKPMDEFEWEKFLKESDQIAEKYGKLLDKYSDHPDRDRLIAREMGWDWLDDVLDAEEKGWLELESESDSSSHDMEPLEPNPLTEGSDWIRDDDGQVQHPLTMKASRLSMEMWHYYDQEGMLSDDGDEDAQNMVFKAQTTSAKLAGALNGLAYDEDRDSGFIVACLKRALNFLHEALDAANRLSQKNVLAPEKLSGYQSRLFGVREEMLKLMNHFRQRKW